MDLKIESRGELGLQLRRGIHGRMSKVADWNPAGASTAAAADGCQGFRVNRRTLSLVRLGLQRLHRKGP